jgi:hypothetical protein
MSVASGGPRSARHWRPVSAARTGDEGAFLLHTFWLAQVQATAGELDRAMATFERAVAAINDAGLLAEEASPDRELIGNFPQASSHIGLINAAWAISQTQQHQAVRRGRRGCQPVSRCASRGIGRAAQSRRSLDNMRLADSCSFRMVHGGVSRSPAGMGMSTVLSSGASGQTQRLS